MTEFDSSIMITSILKIAKWVSQLAKSLFLLVLKFLGLKLMNLHEIRNPIALRIFDTPGRDKGEEFFVPG